MIRRLALLAALPLLLAGHVARAEITIYRCTAADGKLTLRDTPCRKGETQQTREMQRPKDAPPSRAKPAKAAPAAAASDAPPTRYVVMAPAQPMYECTTPDGNQYLSDTGQGNPRWVPLWTLGYPVVVPRGVREDSGFYARAGGSFNGGDGRYDVRVGDSPSPRPPPQHPEFPVSYGAGTWIYDECHALPQEEVCSRLRDRRWTLDRRYNSALQSERHQIDEEQRGIDARLNRDCGDS
ncbi:DUF4124 domain-containing protein [Lysobacter panacisoli]|uniref:DUF4124 domain-containing protein n=1 Tax=Lysobacter panacisoli TaxID=1255263 RepID=A0ABP9L4H5_9GAMM|nr:DUF4124 domain-containing protein [Lysobacter panacisoli]